MNIAIQTDFLVHFFDNVSRVFSITLPVFLVIAVGFWAVKSKHLPASLAPVLGQFVARIAMPVLLFKIVATKDIATLWQPVFLLIFTTAALCTAMLGFLWARYVLKMRHENTSESIIIAMGMCSSNTGFVGIPIALAMFGEPAMAALALCFLVENLIVLPLLMSLAEVAKNGTLQLKPLLRSLAGNTFLWGVGLGVIVSATGLGAHIPAPIYKALDLLALSASACALVVIGAGLVGANTAGMGRHIAQMAVGKLVLHPLIASAFIAVFAYWGGAAFMQQNLAPMHATLLVLSTACPTMGLYAVVSLGLGNTARAAATVIGTTLLAFVTLSVWIGVLG